MSSLLYKVFNPNIVPKLQGKLAELPLPETAQNIIKHPAGPFTIHFWAPTFKWSISIANILDFQRPVEKVSAAQQSVNLAMGVSGLFQLARIAKHKWGDAATPS
eukprot:GHVU01196522.1.p3 GENE.GHVU01196522.1~~GHVU01196522.1.p3  ORF type:complete len:104 (-),score=9.69 GHVU01196522.1:1274-1585(-)